MSRQKTIAKLIQVLLWYDEPQIVLLGLGGQRYVVGVAIEQDDMHSPFIGVEVSVRQLLDYKIQRIDLRYLYMHPDCRKWWLFDLNQDPGELSLRRIKADDPRVDSSAPETGFFSRFHEEISGVDLQSADSVQKFDIDGTWDLGEFSQFYGQVEDLYYMFHNAREYKRPDASAARKAQIKDAFLRPFRGGGSYLALYNDFANDNDRAARLRVSGIQYHSPGYVEVKALQEPITDTIELLGNYAERLKELKPLYTGLHKTLSAAGLLRGEPRASLGQQLRDDIQRRSEALASAMDGLTFKDYLDFTDGNLVISSKVLLSVFRRVDRLYQFFLEGRAKHTDVPVA